MSNQSISSPSGDPIPAWLETPATSCVDPPVDTRLQELPLAQLTWQNFEKLCLRLVRKEATTECCRLYGTPGQGQEGIDIYARQRLEEKYRVYECKRVTGFGPSKIRAAVSKFLVGEWVDKVDTFVLCTKESLRATDRSDEIEAQSSVLRDKQIALIPWDSEELSTKLKDFPDIVDDFFGRPWVKAFCGPEAASNLGRRLDVQKVIELRKVLARVYRNIFDLHDPGLPIVLPGAMNPMPIEERYVMPQVYSVDTVTLRQSTMDARPDVSRDELQERGPGDISREGERRSTAKFMSSTIVDRQRQNIEIWLGATNRALIVGGPGAGKSTLLRFIATDLLRETPKLTILAERWGALLPIWVPFALWAHMISNSPTQTCSLGDLLRNWLKNWNEDRLWPLVEQAIEDERLLLLVDGLDEWTDEAAARIALDRLMMFVEQRNVATLITTRPYGLQQMGVSWADWQAAELCDLSVKQQKTLARVWFKHRAISLSLGSSDSEIHAEREANAQTEAFFNELRESADLQDLATVPLLLCLLICHKFYGAQLPESRFKAYNSLVELLLSAHPQRRRTSAAVSTPPLPNLSNEDLKMVLGRLAYYIQESSGTASVEDPEALTSLEDFLKDSSGGLGLSHSEAHRYAQQILDVGENTLGLLVRWAPDQICFFHRTLRDCLAAYYLSGLDKTRQLKIIEAYCGDPQWRELILAMFYFTRRVEDIEQFLTHIRRKRESSNTIARHSIDCLLSEIAFGDFNCPSGESKKIAKQVIQEIESGSWMPHRENLLRHLLVGLRSVRFKDFLENKVKAWFPCRLEWREGVYQAMANWPSSPDVVECLFRGVHDEEPRNQRAAAISLAKIGNNDTGIEDRLALLALTEVDPTTRAAAIEALLSGWPEHEKLQDILEGIKDSISPELRLIAIIGRIKLKIQTEDNWKELIHLGSFGGGLNRAYHDSVAEALQAGWPESNKTKVTCLDALTEYASSQDDVLERELALKILLEGYPQDEEIAQYCVREIKSEDFPFILLHPPFQPWRLLARNFKNHPLVVDAVDAWMPKQKYKEMEVSSAALIGCTPTGKSVLLKSLADSHRFWSAAALIEGWGMGDVEIAEKLKELAYGPEKIASSIGHLLPKVIEDEQTCRERLLEILCHSECNRLDFVMRGLSDLANSPDDDMVVSSVIQVLSERMNPDSLFYRAVVHSLILGYGANPKVREIAKRRLQERDGECVAAAMTYGEDEEIRTRIIRICSPLPALLRSVLVERLGQRYGDGDFSTSLMKRYDCEVDPRVKTQASISYYSKLMEAGESLTEEIESLSKTILCYGHDYEARRQAAFCGLLTIKRLDIMKEAHEQSAEKKPCTIALTPFISPNVVLIRHMLESWDYVKSTFGDEVWDRISRLGSSRASLWNTLCTFANDYPSARDEALQFYEENKDCGATANVLHFLARARPKSALLLEYILKAIKVDEVQADILNDAAIVAAELLGTHFGGDSDVLDQVTSKYKGADLACEKIIVALCEAWPKSPQLEEALQIVRSDKRPLSWATYIRLLCRKGPADKIFDKLVDILSKAEDSVRLRYRLRDYRTTFPIIRRLKTDTALAERMCQHLDSSPTPSEKASIPKLIAPLRERTSKLEAWCIGEIDKQLGRTVPPEIGFDLHLCERQPVVHSVLDVVSKLHSDSTILVPSQESTPEWSQIDRAPYS